MREKIIYALFWMANLFAVLADDLRTPENENKTYTVLWRGKPSDWC